MLTHLPAYSNCSTELVTEMPRCFSMSIQSDTAWRALCLPLTEPAWLMAPPYSSSFSVSVVLPASGWLMMANVRRRSISSRFVIVGRVPFDQVLSESVPQGGTAEAKRLHG
jgi:hypothetical protein